MTIINTEAMEEKILKILRENRIGHAKAHYLKHELLDLLLSLGVIKHRNIPVLTYILFLLALSVLWST